MEIRNLLFLKNYVTTSNINEIISKLESYIENNYMLLSILEGIPSDKEKQEDYINEFKKLDLLQKMEVVYYSTILWEYYEKGLFEKKSFFGKEADRSGNIYFEMNKILKLSIEQLNPNEIIEMIQLKIHSNSDEIAKLEIEKIQNDVANEMNKDYFNEEQYLERLEYLENFNEYLDDFCKKITPEGKKRK